MLSISENASLEGGIDASKQLGVEAIEKIKTHLSSEGFPDETITYLIKEGLVSYLNAQEAFELGFRIQDRDGKFELKGKKYFASSGLLFKSGDFPQIRCDDQSHGKYLTQSGRKIDERCVFLPPDCDDFVVVTEGAKDSFSATLMGGIPTIGVAGVSHIKKAIPAGKGTITIFDSDGRRNPKVIRSLLNAAIHTEGKINLIPDVPNEPKAGFCEWFKYLHKEAVEQGIDPVEYKKQKYKELISNAMTPKQYLFCWAKEFDKIPEDKRDSNSDNALGIFAKFSAKLLSRDEREMVAKQISKSSGIPTPSVRGTLEGAYDVYYREENQNKEDSGKEDSGDTIVEEEGHFKVETTFEDVCFVNLFQEGQGDWKTENNSYFSYTGKGFWKRIEDAKVKKQIADFSRKCYVMVGGKNPRPQYSFSRETNKSNAFKFCASALTVAEKLSSDHLVAFSNGTVDLRTGQLLAHSRDHHIIAAVNAPYNPGADCPGVFRDFISEVFGEEMLSLIRAAIFMYLDPTALYGKFLHIIGPSGSGKGTLLRLIQSFFHEEQTSQLSAFSEISTPETRHQNLSGRRFVAFPDLGGYQQGLRAFYELVDNGPMNGRALFNADSYSKRWHCRFICASVDYLQIENAGDGWDRRCIPLPTRIRKQKEDPDLGRKLQEVKGEIISWALAMPREERDELLLNSAKWSQAIVDVKSEQSIANDSIKSFIDACLRPTDSIVTTENYLLHDWYTAYCKVHGYSPVSINKFVSHFKNVLPHNHVARERRRVNGQRVNLPAHWKAIAPLPECFIDLLQDDPSNGHQGTVGGNPQWACIKARCIPGGLDDFKEFFEPTPPPPSDPNAVPGMSQDGGLSQDCPRTEFSILGQPETPSGEGLSVVTQVSQDGGGIASIASEKEKDFGAEVVAVQAEIPYLYGNTLPTPHPGTPGTVSESQAGQGFWLSQDTGSHPGTVLGQDEDLGTEAQATPVTQQTEARSGEFQSPVEELAAIFDEHWSHLVVGGGKEQCKTEEAAIDLFRVLTQNYSPEQVASAVDVVNSAPGRQVVRRLHKLCELCENTQDSTAAHLS